MKKLSVILFVAILLAACQSAATPQPTAVPPTPAPVEALAGSIDDLVGVWGDFVYLEFKADGTLQMFFGSGNQRDIIIEDSYTFDAGKITFPARPIAPCKDNAAIYEAYVTKQGGERISLRMQVVGSDTCVDRADSLKSPFPFHNP